ncbi:MAG: aldo/keto reductase [Alphaproteobacteria bacterium]
MTGAARFWPALGRSLPVLGFGCWQLAGTYSVAGRPQGWGAMADDKAIRLVHDALEAGIVFFDTAAAYGHGRSECLLGRALKTARMGADAVVCTKIALREDEIAHGRFDGTLAQRVEESLGRLQREAVDVLLLHNPPDDLPWTAFDPAPLDDLIHAGKVRAYGVSARSLKGAMAAAHAGFGTCIEWVYHLLERRPQTDLFGLMESRSMTFIARSPLARGLLSRRGLEHAQIRFDTDDFRSTLPPDWLAWTAEGVKRLGRLADAPGGMSASALRFCLSHPAVSAVIPGVRRPEHLDSLIKASAEGPLDAGTLAWIDRSTPAFYPPWG